MSTEDSNNSKKEGGDLFSALKEKSKRVSIETLNKKKEFEEEKVFESVIKEDSLLDEKINFFTKSDVGQSEKQASAEPFSEATRKSDAEGGVPDESLLLNEPSSASQILEAKTKGSDGKKVTTSSADKDKINTSNFADIFVSRPIEVQEKAAEMRPRKPLNVRKGLIVGGSALVSLGSVALLVFALTSDRGLFGIRLEEGKFTKAYRPPNAETQKAFETIFEESRQARLEDDPRKIEQVISSLELILEKDERNIEAFVTLLEHLGILVAWYGVSSSWSQKFEQVFEQIQSVSKKIKTPIEPPGVKRALAWKYLAVGLLDKAEETLTKESPQDKISFDEETLILLAELAYNRGKKEEALAWLGHLSKSEYFKSRYLNALLREQKDEMSALVALKYLPAQIFEFVSQPVTEENISIRIQETVPFAEQVKIHPHLWKLVQDYHADLLTQKGSRAEARLLWKEILFAFPRDMKIWTKLGTSFEKDALWDEALGAYRSADKSGEIDQTVSLKFIQLLHLKGYFIEAIKYIDKILTHFPNSIEFIYEKGRVQLALYQEDAALSSFKKALELDSVYEPALLGLAELYLEKKDFNQAEFHLKKIVPTSPHYARTLEGLAHIAETKKRWEEAKSFYLKALEKDPQFEFVYPKLVALYLKDENDVEAQKIVQKGLLRLPESPYLKIAYARVLQFKKMYSEAWKGLKEIQQKYSHLLEVQFACADVLIDRGHVDEALNILNTLMSKEVRSAELSYLRAKALFFAPKHSSPDSAYRLVELAIAAKPQEIRYRLLAAQIAVKNQEKALAFDHVDEALKLDAQNAIALTVRGDIHQKNEEQEKAIYYYREALKNTRFQAPIYKKLAQSYKLQNKNVLAIQNYQKAIRLEPNDSEAYLEIGKIYGEEGRYREALKNFKRVIQLNPKRAESYYHLGFIQKELGDRKGAIRSFEGFLALDPQGSEASTIRDELYFLKNNKSNN